MWQPPFRQIKKQNMPTTRPDSVINLYISCFHYISVLILSLEAVTHFLFPLSFFAVCLQSHAEEIKPAHASLNHDVTCCPTS